MIRSVFLVLTLLALVACDRKGEPGRLARCTCEFLTDRDQPGQIAVEFCAPPREIDEAARSCAQGLGVGLVSHCRCEGSGEPCPKAGECRHAGEP